MLKLGNCLDLIKEIPDNSIDLVVTDPPYKITARGNGGNSGGMFQKKIVNSGYVFAHNELDISDWLDEVYRVLKDSTHVGDTVLDPFMGINSTGIACKLLGRKFIGFEINKKYFDVAKERLMI